MADEKAAAAQEPAASSPARGKEGKGPILLMALAVVNMAAVVGVGLMIWKQRQADIAQPKIDHVIQGEAHAQKKEASEEKIFIGRIIPLETFIVNLACSKGRRIAKVNMELEIQGENIQEEIEKRKAQIRDIIIIILSGKTYDEVANREGKEKLRDEVKDTVNGFLTKGKIVNVYFTEFIYQ